MRWLWNHRLIATPRTLNGSPDIDSYYSSIVMGRIYRLINKRSRGGVRTPALMEEKIR
jgi:hypothetical protein